MYVLSRPAAEAVLPTWKHKASAELIRISCSDH